MYPSRRVDHKADTQILLLRLLLLRRRLLWCVRVWVVCRFRRIYITNINTIFGRSTYIQKEIHTLHTLHTYKHMYIHTSIHPCMHACMHACNIHAYMHVHTNSYLLYHVNVHTQHKTRHITQNINPYLSFACLLTSVVAVVNQLEPQRPTLL